MCLQAFFEITVGIFLPKNLVFYSLHPIILAVIWIFIRCHLYWLVWIMVKCTQYSSLSTPIESKLFNWMDKIKPRGFVKKFIEQLRKSWVMYRLVHYWSCSLSDGLLLRKSFVNICWATVYQILKQHFVFSTHTHLHEQSTHAKVALWNATADQRSTHKKRAITGSWS